VSDVASYVLNVNGSEILNMPIDTFRWYFASEDATTPAFPGHTGVLGRYADDATDWSLESFWLLTDDSYGRGRLELEGGWDVPISEVSSYALSSDVLAISPTAFTWFLTTEDSATPAHSTHGNAQGVFTPYDNSGINDYESTWIILDEESNATSGNHTIGQETNTTRVEDGDAIVAEGGEEENINMLWEDGQKQLITDPQAFIVGAITNDTSLTVTRKHLGGTTDSVYRI
jgi:hypothetical protein